MRLNPKQRSRSQLGISQEFFLQSRANASYTQQRNPIKLVIEKENKNILVKSTWSHV